jgi:MFS superfamily sulfate permease-like transporter
VKRVLPEYRKDWLRFDAVAGLTTAAVVIPKSIAYASIAGLPVQAGLYVSLGKERMFFNLAEAVAAFEKGGRPI